MRGIALLGAVNSWLYRIIGFSELMGEPNFQWDLLGCLQGGELRGDSSPDGSWCVRHRAPSCSSDQHWHTEAWWIVPRVSVVEKFFLSL